MNTNIAVDIGLVIQLPAKNLGENASEQEQTLERLCQLLETKTSLFIKTTNVDQLDLSLEEGKIGFASWNNFPSFEEISALTELSAALVAYAGKVLRVATKPD